MPAVLPPDALDTLFREARTYNSWSPEPIPEQTLRDLYDLVKFGPTSANTSPARFLFVTSKEGRERLARVTSEANAPKVLQAPCTVIIAHDLNFADKMPYLFPHNPGARHWFDNVRVAEATAFRNGTLQGGYLIMAARALGLDCGPMSGFDANGVDAEFFPDSTVKSNFICLLGHGTTENLFPRSPRLSFDDACAFA